MGAKIEISEDAKSKICQRYKLGESSLKLARDFGVSTAWILALLRNQGVQVRHGSIACARVIPFEDEALVCSMYKAGDTLKSIADKFGAKGNLTISIILKRHNVSPRGCRDRNLTYKTNETAFNSLASASTYWIGMLMADGCVSKGCTLNARKVVSLSLKVSDIGHIQKFSKFIDTNVPIACDKRGQAMLQVYSDGLAEDLFYYGVVPRKSCVASPHPSLLNNRHFWRGMVDGDGCICINKKKQRGKLYRSPHIDLVGSFDCVNGFRNYIVKCYPTFARKIRKSGVIWRIMAGGRAAMAVIKNLYTQQDVDMALERKFKLVMKLIDEFGDGSAPGKFSDDQVRVIRRSRENHSELGRMFAVTRETIRNVRNRITYKSVAA